MFYLFKIQFVCNSFFYVYSLNCSIIFSISAICASFLNFGKSFNVMKSSSWLSFSKFYIFSFFFWLSLHFVILLFCSDLLLNISSSGSVTFFVISFNSLISFINSSSTKELSSKLYLLSSFWFIIEISRSFESNLWAFFLICWIYFCLVSCSFFIFLSICFSFKESIKSFCSTLPFSSSNYCFEVPGSTTWTIFWIFFTFLSFYISFRY